MSKYLVEEHFDDVMHNAGYKLQAMKMVEADSPQEAIQKAEIGMFGPDELEVVSGGEDYFWAASDGSVTWTEVRKVPVFE